MCVCVRVCVLVCVCGCVCVGDIIIYLNAKQKQRKWYGYHLMRGDEENIVKSEPMTDMPGRRKEDLRPDG